VAGHFFITLLLDPYYWLLFLICLFTHLDII
jgi:hypothetical protein